MSETPYRDSDLHMEKLRVESLCKQRDELQDEIIKLTAERDNYHQDRDNWRASCKHVENERDAAYVRGLDVAKNIYVSPFLTTSSLIAEGFVKGVQAKINAIQAEINKAKGST